MRVRFWGTRGSIPTPGPQTTVYGGNTSCVEVQLDDGTVIILDSGTGIRELGLQLMQAERPLARLYVFIGHMHWDHIQGFPFFTPAFLPTTELNIFAPTGFQRSLEASLSGQMQYSYFPIKLQELSSRIHYTELEEGFFRLGDVLVETQYLNHTAPTLAYRITDSGASLAYVTDHEPYWNDPGAAFQHPGDQRHVEFLRGCDLVIHDAQYSEGEYSVRKGWGHSPIDYATDVALAAEVRQLALFHHDPMHCDDTIREFERHAQTRVANARSPLQVVAAAEGLEITIAAKPTLRTVYKDSALDRRPTSGGRILVISERHQDIELIERALAEDGLIVSGASNRKAAIAQAAEQPPDLVIAESRLADGAELIPSLREASGRPDLPVLLLAEDAHVETAAATGTNTVTDYLAAPFSPPMLRSRVRAWLARTMTPPEVQAGRSQQLSEGAPPVTEVRRDEISGLVGLFGHLDASQLDRLLAHSTQCVYPAGYAVIQHPDQGPSVHVVLSGRVRMVERLPENPVEIFLDELGPGEVFGELGIMRERARAATIIPIERTVCLTIPNDDFLDALRLSPEMAIELVRIIAGRLYKADRMIARYGPDPLTGLPGRRALNDLYKRMVAGVRRRGSSILLLAIDVVHLKTINDVHGYSTGDDVLRAVGDVLLDCSRGTDLVARYGSDEFAALFVEAAAEHAEVVTSRIQKKFAQFLEQRGLPSSVELRIGHAVSSTPPDTFEDLLRLADVSLQNRRSGVAWPL